MLTSLNKWQVLLASDLTVPADEPRRAAFAPLGAFAAAVGLREAELNRLYWLFLSFYAEAFITLEQALMLSLRSSAKAEQTPAAQQVLREELYHSRAFAAAMHGFQALQFPRDYIFLRKQRRLRNALAWVARRLPSGLALPAAKFEVFTINYGRFVAKHFPREHPWAQVNRLHIEDELGHVQFDFAWYRQVMLQPWRARLQTLLGAFLFTLLTQLMSFAGAVALVRLALPERSVCMRWRATWAFAAWNLRQFAPYQQSRLSMRRHFRQHTPRYGKLFAFMHW